jgi:hypothetical protein
MFALLLEVFRVIRAMLAIHAIHAIRAVRAIGLKGVRGASYVSALEVRAAGARIGEGRLVGGGHRGRCRQPARPPGAGNAAHGHRLHGRGALGEHSPLGAFRRRGLAGLRAASAEELQQAFEA